MSQWKYRCPKCGATRIMATAVVAQDWEIDENGDFVDIYDGCAQVYHYPVDDLGYIWQCMNCDYDDRMAAFRYEVPDEAS